MSAGDQRGTTSITLSLRVRKHEWRRGQVPSGDAPGEEAIAHRRQGARPTPPRSPDGRPAGPRTRARRQCRLLPDKDSRAALPREAHARSQHAENIADGDPQIANAGSPMHPVGMHGYALQEFGRACQVSAPPTSYHILLGPGAHERGRSICAPDMRTPGGFSWFLWGYALQRIAPASVARMERSEIRVRLSRYAKR